MSQSPAPANRYLWFRPESSTIWFRMAVPKAYRQRAGRNIVLRPLGTSDVREARLAAGRLRADLFEQWRGGIVPTLRDLEDLAATVGYEMELDTLDEGRRNMKGRGPHMFVANVRWHQAVRADRTMAVATGESAPVEHLADEWIERLGWELPRGSDGYSRLCELLSLATHEASKTHQRRLAGDIEADTESKLIQRVRSSGSSDDAMLDLFDRYAVHKLREGKRPDSVAQDKVIVEQFAGFLGADHSLKSVTRNDVRDFRDTLAALPRSYRNSKVYRGLDMRAAARMASSIGTPGLSVATINKNLSQLSPFFAWAVTNGYIDTNPFDGLFLKSSNSAKPYPPFTAAQLTEMFSSPLFVGFERDGREHKAGSCRADDWRYWIPLLCLFTGSRIGEMAQLHTDDVRKEHGRWFIHICEDHRTGQRTKSRKTRVVPVHPKLEAIGFLGFHGRQCTRAEVDGNRQLFPLLEPNARGQIGAQPSKFWRRYLGKLGIKDGGDGFGSHSFRHTMADELRMAGFMDDRFGPLILGHTKGGVTAGYGRMPQGTADMLCAMIDAVAFKDVEFDHLIASD